MPLRSGLAAQLGIAAENTWGVYQAPDHWYELVSETMKLDRTRTLAKGIRPSKTMPRSQRFRTTKVSVGGDLNLEVHSNSYGLLFKHMLGAAAQTADGAGFKRTYTLGDPFGLGLSVQIGTVAINGSVLARSYIGCKVSDWNIKTSIDNPLDITLTLDGFNEDTTKSLGTPTWPSTTTDEVFFANDCGLTIAGTTLKVYDISITGKNNAKYDRYYVGTQMKGEPVLNAFRDITGTITCDFNDFSIYNYFVNDDTATGQIVMTTTGQKTYDTAKPNKIVLTLPTVRYDGESPQVSGPDLTRMTIPFTIMDNDSAQPITLDYYTADSAD